MLGDYALAQRTYKSLSEVYHSEAVPLWEAGALEMQVISTMMIGPPSMSREEDNLLDQSEKLYRRANAPSHARRSQMIRAIIVSQWYKDRRFAASLYASMADREMNNLSRALFHEQAAYNYLLVPNHRKYSFRLILAAECFGQIPIFDHALRCLSQAYRVYVDQRWSFIDDHLHFRLARLAFILGKVNMAAEFMNKLLANNTQNPDLQNEYIREYMYIFQATQNNIKSPLVQSNNNNNTTNTTTTYLNNSSTSAEPKVFEVPLPILDTKKVKVCLRDANEDEDDLLLNSSSDVSWQKLIENVETIVLPKEKRSVFFLLKKRKGKLPIAVVNENIYVETELINPLKVPVQLTNMRLICEHVPGNGLTASGEMNGDGVVIKSDSEQFEVQPCDTLLRPLDVKRVLFAIKPLSTGKIIIKGITFKFFGQVEGQRMFSINNTSSPSSPPLSVISSPLVSKNANPMQKLEVIVCEPMPLLNVEFTNWPTSDVRQGELYPLKMKLSNNGQTPISQIAVSLSHPRYFSFPQFSNASENLWNYNDDLDENVLNLSSLIIPLQEPLDSNNSIELPLWLRAYNTGTHSFKFMFYYATPQPNPNLKYRLQRAVASLTVLPSVQLKTYVVPSQTNPYHYLVGLTLENLTENEIIEVSRIQSLCKYFETIPMNTKKHVRDDVDNHGDGDGGGDGGGGGGGDSSSVVDNSSWKILPSKSISILLNVNLKQSTNTSDESVSVIPILKNIFPPSSDTSSTSSPSESDNEPWLDFLYREQTINEAKNRPTNSSSSHSTTASFDLYMPIDQQKQSEQEQSRIARQIARNHMLHLIISWKRLDGKYTGQLNCPDISLLAPEPWDCSSYPTVLPSNRSRVLSISRTPTASANNDKLQSTSQYQWWKNVENYTSTPSNFQNHHHSSSPIAFYMHSAKEVKGHNFDVNNFCEVTVTITVVNISPFHTISFQFEALKPDTLSDPMTPKYFWTGKTTIFWPSLKPKESCTLTLKSAFTKSGVYNINNVKFIVHVQDQADATKQTTRTVYSVIPHLLYVD
eukprot:TRINITY_DN4261_c0_g1_i2.p1 TRINITY_DN4261_c0_g1~~TRINITY_DN4261_c0_g1_i2.p1  ORF type:complete len:1035 (+),score=251.81 TRINITY_DN4261_c0_g1_i2:1026-4130(+)